MSNDRRDPEPDDAPEEERDDWVIREFRDEPPKTAAGLRLERRSIEALRRHEEFRTRYNLLDVRPADEWVRLGRRERLARQLFGELWRENDLSIMFADTGVGKSLLAVQIADSIVRGRPIKPFGMTALPQRVLVLDFEMTHRQFHERYSSGADPAYRFGPGILRAQVRWEGSLPEKFRSYGEFVQASIEDSIDEHRVKVLIVDNISWLSDGGFGSEKAMRLMKALKQLKSDKRVSILVLAHTAKRSDTAPISVDDLAGSKMLANFADNIFAVGRSAHDTQIRYIKQLKQRNSPIQYDAANVAVFRIRADAAFPRFEFIRSAHEAAFLRRSYDTLAGRRRSALAPSKQTAEIRKLHRQGHSCRQIAARLGISRSSVSRICRV